MKQSRSQRLPPLLTTTMMTDMHEYWQVTLCCYVNVGASSSTCCYYCPAHVKRDTETMFLYKIIMTLLSYP